MDEPDTEVLSSVCLSAWKNSRASLISATGVAPSDSSQLTVRVRGDVDVLEAEYRIELPRYGGMTDSFVSTSFICS